MPCSRVSSFASQPLSVPLRPFSLFFSLVVGIRALIADSPHRSCYHMSWASLLPWNLIRLRLGMQCAGNNILQDCSALPLHWKIATDGLFDMLVVVLSSHVNWRRLTGFWLLQFTLCDLYYTIREGFMLSYFVVSGFLVSLFPLSILFFF